MTNKEQLIDILYEKLVRVEQSILELDEAEKLSELEVSEFQKKLVILQTKDIPAQACSNGKLQERIEEVESLISELKHLAN